jgi:outer membrane protein assembly factor BamB
VHCLDARTGRLHWAWEAGGEVDSSPVITGESVLVGSGDGRLVLLDLASGKETWTYDLGEPVHGSPALAGGMAVVACEDGALYAFGE